MGCCVASNEEISVLLDGLQAPVVDVRSAALKVSKSSKSVSFLSSRTCISSSSIHVFCSLLIRPFRKIIAVKEMENFNQFVKNIFVNANRKKCAYGNK